MYDIFISYAKADNVAPNYIITDVILALRKSTYPNRPDQALKVWFDEHNLPIGEYWKEGIQRGIEQARSMAIFMSTRYFASKICNYEFETAVDLGKLIIPIWLEEINAIQIVTEIENRANEGKDTASLETAMKNYQILKALQAIRYDRDTTLGKENSKAKIAIKSFENITFYDEAEHWLQRATAHQRGSAGWLDGEELEQAQGWLATVSVEKIPNVTREYILESAYRAETQFRQAESRRLILLASELADAEVATLLAVRAIHLEASPEALKLLQAKVEKIQVAWSIHNKTPRGQISLTSRGEIVIAHIDSQLGFGTLYSLDGQIIQHYKALQVDQGNQVKAICTTQNHLIASYHKNKSVAFRRVADGEIVRQFHLPFDISHFSVAPNSHWIAGVSSNFDRKNNTTEYYVIIWSLHKEIIYTSVKTRGIINRLVFSPDSTRLAVADGVEGVILINLSTTELNKIGREVTAMDFAFSPSGQEIAAIYLAETFYGEIIQLTTGEIKLLQPASGSLTSLSFSADGSQIFGTIKTDNADYNHIRVWNSHTGLEIGTISTSVEQIIQHPTKTHLVAIQAEHIIGIRLAPSNKIDDFAANIGTCLQMKLSADSCLLMSLSGNFSGLELTGAISQTAHLDEFFVDYWDVPSRSHIARLPLHTIPLTKNFACDFSPEAQLVLLGNDSGFHVYTREGNSYQVTFNDLIPSIMMTEISPSRKSTEIQRITLTPAGTEAIICIRDKQRKYTIVWDLGTKTVISTLDGHSHYIQDKSQLVTLVNGNTLIFHSLDGYELDRWVFPNNAIHFCVSNDGRKSAIYANQHIYIFNRGNNIASHQMEVHEKVKILQFSADGTLLFMLGDKNLLKVWHSEEGRLLKMFEQYAIGMFNNNLGTFAQRVSLNNQYFFVAQYLRPNMIWDFSLNRPYHTFGQSKNPINATLAATFLPNANAIIYSTIEFSQGRMTGSLHYQILSPQGYLDYACNRVTRNLTPQEYERFQIQVIDVICP